MSQENIDDVVSGIVVAVVAYVAAECAFKAYRSVKKRRANRKLEKAVAEVIQIKTPKVKTKVR